MEKGNQEEPERPPLTLKNRMAQFPVITTTEQKLYHAKMTIIEKARTAESALDLHMLHALMDDLLKFDE